MLPLPTNYQLLTGGPKNHFHMYKQYQDLQGSGGHGKWEIFGETQVVANLITCVSIRLLIFWRFARVQKIH